MRGICASRRNENIIANISHHAVHPPPPMARAGRRGRWRSEGGPNTCDSGTVLPDCPHQQQLLQRHPGAAPLHIHNAVPNTSTDQWGTGCFVCIQNRRAYRTSISPQNNQTPQSSPRSVNSADARSKTAAGGCGRLSSRRHHRLIGVHFDARLRALLTCVNLEWGGSFTMQVRKDEQCLWRCTFAESLPDLLV